MAIFSFSCGGPVGSVVYPQNGTSSLDLAGYNGTPTYALEAGADNGHALSLGGTASIGPSAGSLGTHGADVDPVDYPNEISVCAQFRVSNLSAPRPIWCTTDNSLYFAFLVYVDTDGKLTVGENVEGLTTFKSTTVLSASTFYDVVVSRWFDEGSYTYYCSINGTIEAMTGGSPTITAWGAPGASSFVRIGASYFDTGAGATNWYFIGNIAKVEIENTALISTASGTYNHTYNACSPFGPPPPETTNSDFWTSFVRSEESTEVGTFDSYRASDDGTFLQGWDYIYPIIVANGAGSGVVTSAAAPSLAILDATDTVNQKNAYHLGVWCCWDAGLQDATSTGVMDYSSTSEFAEVGPSAPVNAGVKSGVYWGAVHGAATAKWVNNPTGEVRIFLPCFDDGAEFTYWHNFSYVAAWNAKIAAWTDWDNATPNANRSVTTNPYQYVSEATRTLYELYYELGYDKTYAILNV